MDLASQTVNTSAAAVCGGPSALVRLALQPTREQSRLMQFEAIAAQATMAKMRDLQENHSLWMAHFDDVDPDTADIELLCGLLETAPNDFAAGLIYGKLTLRAQLAAISGRPF